MAKSNETPYQRLASLPGVMSRNELFSSLEFDDLIKEKLGRNAFFIECGTTYTSAYAHFLPHDRTPIPDAVLESRETLIAWLTTVGRLQYEDSSATG